MRCCAHILNLIVKDGMKKIRDSVAFWKATPKRKEKFEEIAKHLRIPCTKSLVLDCPTKWNLTYKMLQIAISYEVMFTRLKQQESQYTCLPSSSFLWWQVILCSWTSGPYVGSRQLYNSYYKKFSFIYLFNCFW